MNVHGQDVHTIWGFLAIRRIAGTGFASSKAARGEMSQDACVMLTNTCAANKESSLYVHGTLWWRDPTWIHTN